MVISSIRKPGSLLALAFFLIAGAAVAESAFPPLTNWTAPATFSPHSASRGASTLADITPPLPFVSVGPCRQYDSRNFTPLPQNTSRAVVLTGAPCGLPASARAVSVNITIFSIIGATGNGVFQVGTATAPTFAWINFPQTETQRGNAGALPLDGSHQLWVRVQMGAGQLDFTVDVNGYYTDTPASGAGMAQFSNTGGYTFFGSNASTTCGGACGIYSEVFTTSAGANALEGIAQSSTGPNYGTTGFSAGGQNSAALDSANSAGVYGNAFNGTAAVNGVTGFTGSTNEWSSGVYGQTANSAANGVSFNNTGGALNGFLGTVLTGTGYGLFTNGHVHGSNIASPELGTIAPHPEDASKQISYLSVEAPTADIYFRGTASLANGHARISVPDHFRLTARGDSYMTTVTAVGSRSTLYIQSEGPDGIEVVGTGNGTFHYVVYAVRDALNDHQPVEENSLYRPETLAKGHTVDSLPAAMRADLIKNGTLNADGTYNQSTAARLGWTIPPPVTAQPAAPTGPPTK